MFTADIYHWLECHAWCAPSAAQACDVFYILFGFHAFSEKSC